MPQAEISFANKQSTGLQELAGAPGVALNVMVDAAGAIRRRPGIVAAPGVYSGYTSGVSPLSGLYKTLGGQLYAVGSDTPFRQIYRITDVAATPLAVATSDGTLAGLSRPTFAETQLLLVVAGGGAMEKLLLSSDVTSRLGGEPPYASHVTANSSRLLGNIAAVNFNNTFDKSVVRFSDIANGNVSYAGMEVWTEGLGTAGHFSAEANPDPVVAIFENTNEVFCFGNKSLQIFAPDPSAVYSPSVTRELGCSAPYSVIKVNQQLAWLDNYRRIVLSDGRSEQILSEPLGKVLNDIEVVDDCFGYRVNSGPLDAMVWTFPTDGRTFAFQKDSGWSQWSGWNAAANNLTQFKVTAHCKDPSGNVDLVATDDGRVGMLSFEATTDLGTLINARVDTGYIARGTDEKKHCKCVRVALKRGQTTGSSSPVALLSYRDQPGPWSAPLVVELGESGDTEPVLEFRSLGVYRRRQWRFEFTGTDALDLMSVIEDYDILNT